MKKNMGGMDRGIRFVIALVIAALYFRGQLNGGLALVLGIIAIAFLITSIVGYCPVYVPLKISTCKRTT